MPLNFKQIAKFRADRGLSQSQAAKLAGFKSIQAWSNLETGTKPDPRVSTVEKLAKALGVKIDDLLK